VARVPIGNPPQGCAAFFISEMEKWGKVIKDTGPNAE